MTGRRGKSTARMIGAIGIVGVLMLLAAYACTVPQPDDSVFTKRTSVFEKTPPDQPAKQEPEEFAQVESGLSPNTNIHFNDRYCLECHRSLPKKDSGEAQLKYDGDFRRLCRCHYKQDRPIHAHPVDTAVPKRDDLKLPVTFPLKNEKISCLTCHDVFVQCRDSEEDRILLQGQMLLRGLPYDHRLEFCFRCHDRSRYTQYNPHDQVNPQGKIIESRCLYCHSVVPDTRRATFEEVQLIGNFDELCTGCHYQTAKQPLHVRHLRRPSEPILARMKLMQAEYNIILPLDRNGRVTCVTCHNPHEKGLIPDQRAGARGAGAAHRHRLQDNMCIKCHPMQPIEAFGSQPP